MNENYCMISFSTQLPTIATSEDIIDACFDILLNIFGNTFDLIITNNDMDFIIHIKSKKIKLINQINHDILKCINFLPTLNKSLKVLIHKNKFKMIIPNKQDYYTFKILNEEIIKRTHNISINF